MIKIKYEDYCVGCPQGCINCGRSHTPVPYFFCDRCKFEVEQLYKSDETGEELCFDCLMEDYNIINEDNYGDYV